MKNRILKISAYTGLAVTAVYTVLNLLCLAFSFPMIFDNAQPFSQAVIGLDGFTWHVYGVFALTTLIINLFYLGEDRSAHKKININVFSVLHAILTVVSLACIVFLFKIAF